MRCSTLLRFSYGGEIFLAAGVIGLLYAKGYVSPRFRISESIESRMFTTVVGDAAQLRIYSTFLRLPFLKPGAKLVRRKSKLYSAPRGFLDFSIPGWTLHIGLSAHLETNGPRVVVRVFRPSPPLFFQLSL